MSSLFASAVKKESKTSLVVFAVILCLLIGVMALQSVKFASSLLVLLEFGHGQWGEHLLSMLGSLAIWAVLTGVVFASEFLLHSPADDPKKAVSGMAVGFVTGFAFTYFLVLIIGILLYIPMGMISLFIPTVIRFATLQFAWLVSAYVIFVLIATDTPRLLFYVIKQGNWYFKLLGILMALLLGVQILRAIVGGLSLIMDNSTWRTNTAVVALGVSLLVTIITNIVLLRGEAIAKTVLAIMAVYIAATVTGNVSYSQLGWGDFPSLILASFVGPITYSFVAKAIIGHGMTAIFGIVGFIGGIIAGLLVDHLTGLRIIGQGWSGILCGTTIVIGFGVAFGLLWGPAISRLLYRARIKPMVSLSVGVGVFLGIIVGMVVGGLIAR